MPLDDSAASSSRDLPPLFDQPEPQPQPPAGMSAKAKRLIVLALIVCVAAGALLNYGSGLYNTLMMRDEAVGAAWSDVINMYRRRADLLPNVINAVQTYAAHERGLLTELAEARAAMLAGLDAASDSPQALARLQQNQQKFTTGLGHLLAVAERYPELKANALFQDLMVEMEGSENRIAYARSRFIGAVADYNLAVRSFPANLIASRVGLKVRPKFDEDLKAVQQVPAMKAP